jgi:hypothetical protein
MDTPAGPLLNTDTPVTRKRAVVYARMSTDHQQYSTENQCDIINEYAVRHDLDIVRVYADEGKSGLRIDGRDSLKKLIDDVQRPQRDFEVILVYDVSRWGRFQDADESAYYEYICRRAGVDVFYCAEQFLNDGSPVSTIVKGVKRAMTITWAYAAGAESTKGFTEGLEKGGGKVIKDLTLPFPNVEFQALLTEIAAQKPDAVYAFFAGGGAVKFVKDYAAAGLNKTIPLYGPGFLTDGTLEAQGAAAQNMLTTLHYADNLDTPKNNAFRKAYAIAYKAQPDVYAVQGYDAAQILANGLKAVGGDLSKRDQLTAAMRKNPVDSPRGKFTLSAAGNPVQDIYLREVKGNNNEFRSVAVKALADPARGCKL